MSNFEYIIASLPVLLPDYKYAEGQGFGRFVDEIRENLSESDNATLDFLLKGFDDTALGEDFYAQALRSRNRFIRKYFQFDLNLRNAKVRSLNARLGRDAEQDILTGENPEAEDADIEGFRFRPGEFDEAAATEAALSEDSILGREKAIDDLYWKKVEEITVFDYFDIEAVLGFVAKLHIADRWLALDPEEGRERFRRLLKEVKGTAGDLSTRLFEPWSR